MSPSWYSNIVRTDDDLKQRQQFYRTRGYDDGYAGRPAGSKDAHYQAGWRRGREARERDGNS